MPVWLAPLLGFLQPVLDRVLPDKMKQAEMQQQLTLAAMDAAGKQLEADMKLALGQLAVNQAEASSGNAYAAGWRPTIGYICAIALLFHYLINPLMLWVVVLTGAKINPPDVTLDSSLWQLMFGMLGIGALRTYEKVKGAAS